MRGRDIPVRSGVYVVQIGERLYVGQTRNLYQRCGAHTSKYQEEVELIYYEFIEEEEARSKREAEIIMEFLRCGLPIMNKRIYDVGKGA